MSPTPARPPSVLDQLTDRFLDRLVELQPMTATEIGVPGHDGELDDLSPAGVEAVADLRRSTLAELDRLERDAGATFDAVDRVTASALRDRLSCALAVHDLGEPYRQLNVLDSAQHWVEDVFSLMPQETPHDWAPIAARLAAIPHAMAQHEETLREGARRNKTPAAYQVQRAARDATAQTGSQSVFAGLVRAAQEAEWAPSRPDLINAIERGATLARAAYGRLAEFLVTDLLPQCADQDGVGEERYAAHSRNFLGATVDQRETYDWGLEELNRIIAEEQAIAHAVVGPGATVAEAVAQFNADPALRVHGTDALRDWMQETADAAIAALNGHHFDLPEPVQVIEGCIAPTHTGAIYYTPPNDDFSRPGRMWWSVPEGVDSFAVWRERTTVYHEGVPGHHLQCAQAVYRAATLNRWRRLACWVSGHGEGWALYAERLMDALGFLETPADRMGMLDGQRLRATRVVLDIGVHLGLPFPGRPGETWNRRNAWEFLRANSVDGDEFLHFELDRYLGWPGQAPSYKIGQRLWEQHRDAALARGLSLKEFHTRALDLGSVGLDTLGEALAAGQ
ncbi:MAG: DUF885 domain-containing protein [Propionibacteriaceae bacterium]|jgi:uncharacterized protein (DUF885 family)|nr:DUF885 domain-containing protein [Propionibacteriaceae bacterium]